NQIAAQDELLKDRRPRTEWKYEDLLGAVKDMKSGRSYGNGRHLFEVASCISCHKVEGKGNEFGPDLAKLDGKLGPAHSLKDILDPSAKIDEKYRVTVFELKSGQQLQGLILKETQTEVTVIENPLANAQPRVIKVSEIDTRDKSKVSLMPK